jgi:hypothetical protein
MRKSFRLAISAGLLSATFFVLAANSAVARPRVTLNQCVSNWEHCMNACPGYFDGPFPPSNNPLADANCRNRCWDNHAACVDVAMSNVRVTNSSTPSRWDWRIWAPWAASAGRR